MLEDSKKEIDARKRNRVIREQFLYILVAIVVVAIIAIAMALGGYYDLR